MSNFKKVFGYLVQLYHLTIARFLDRSVNNSKLFGRSIANSTTLIIYIATATAAPDIQELMNRGANPLPSTI